MVRSVHSWILQILINLGVGLVTRYGIPWVEQSAPYLVPLLEEILKVIKGAEPSKNLSKASDHYLALCNGVACPPQPVDKP